AVASTRDQSDPAATCSDALASSASISRVAHKHCVMAVAGAYLGARTGHRSPSAVPLDPKVAAYNLGETPAHAAGGAAKVRAALSKDTTKRVGKVQWVIDG